jgi:hypothetical protein
MAMSICHLSLLYAARTVKKRAACRTIGSPVMMMFFLIRSKSNIRHASVKPLVSYLTSIDGMVIAPCAIIMRVSKLDALSL